MAKELDKYFPEREELEEEVLRWADEHAEEFAEQMEGLGHENPQVPKADPRVLADRVTRYEADVKFERSKIEAKFAEKVRPTDSKQGRQRAADRMKPEITNRLNYERGRNKEMLFQTLDELRQKAFGITHYRWKTRGDGRVRVIHRENDRRVFAWNEPSEITGHPGEQWGCRCRAVPASLEEAYNPEEDAFYQFLIEAWGKTAIHELESYEEEVQKAATKLQPNGKYRDVDPALVKAVIVNESATRAGGGRGDAIGSLIFSDFGTYGPAQLGPEARNDENLDVDEDGNRITILEALSYEGAIEGAANWLDKQRVELEEEGIENPTNGQIASRYNNGNADVRDKITEYGIRIEYLIERFYHEEDVDKPEELGTYPFSDLVIDGVQIIKK